MQFELKTCLKTYAKKIQDIDLSLGQFFNDC